MTSVNQQNKIDASVSKSFFVEMLVKDISLPMAIHDLIDNCIDGARALRGEERFDGLEVDLRLLSDEFSISDNCGGIDLEIAKNYAFRFGRPKNAPGIRHSIGRFGVGMKRAVFKLGRRFSVRSTSKKSRFEVEVDVLTWEQTDQWEFQFKSVQEFDKPITESKRGTILQVTELLQPVSEQFSLDYFLNNLRASIAARYQIYLESGLVVKVNGKSVLAAPVRFLVSESDLTPAYREATYNGMVIREVVGVGDAQPSDAGWYMYCNGRLILRADQTETTGWGEAGVERIPKYHNAFARFRGCVYFDSDDPKALPWNTTKDGVDQESGIYRSVRTEMVNLMKPVLNFLRELAKEQDEPEDSQLLTRLLKSAQSKPVAALHKRDTFFYVKPKQKVQGPKIIKIRYDRPENIVEKVKNNLKVSSAKAVGEKTFDYYVNMEVEE